VDLQEFSYMRSMDESDLTVVYEIEQQAYQFPWSLQGFEKSLDQGLNYLFCNRQDAVLGYCCILPVLNEAHILNFCVSPAFQRKGVARQALAEVIRVLKASNYEIAMLEVRVSNLAARNLYSQFGFSEDGLRKAYYRDQSWDEERQQLVACKEDAVLMSLCF
jgi:ribosomal-protein-alanine N-acetyltransferase